MRSKRLDNILQLCVSLETAARSPSLARRLYGLCIRLGDDWQHQVVLEKTLVPKPESIYLACIASERSDPPEDVGGAGGYAEFLEAIANPDHEEHDAMLEWAGGQFDPQAFSVTEVNARLRRELRRARRR